MILDPMNVRSGPGTDYEVIGAALPTERYPVTGVNAAGDWWRIDYNGRPAWIYGPLVHAENTDAVEPVVSPAAPLATPAPPTANDAATAADGPSTATPQPDNAVALAPAPAPVGTVVVYETSVTLPTYPRQPYESAARNQTFHWPYPRFDYERFENEAPAPAERTYRLLVLENVYLKVTILPELGGRVWQAIHKPSGANMFYQNPVVKPSPWGPQEQLGWIAVGGLEWNLPVVEHGYDWGVEWGYLPLQHSADLASVTIFTPRDGRALNASVTISLRSGAGSFEVEPTLANLSDQTLDFAYWQAALLAPGAGNKPSGSTQLILPGAQMTVHSTGDGRLPEAGRAFDWPVYGGVDFSRLGNWNQYLGFFERPAAHGPFAAVYDHEAGAGAVRVYPADVVRGSKVFGLGWHAALDSELYTDDGSAYVELHGGLAPTFDETYQLPPGGSVSWREIWYPVDAIGGITYADEVVALHVRPSDGGLAVGIYPTRPLDGVLVALADGQEIGRRALEVRPDAPADGALVSADRLPRDGPVEIRFEDAAGRLFFRYTYTGSLR